MLVFINDATSRIMHLRLVASESTSLYFEVLQRYLESQGYPVAFSSDKHLVFYMNLDAAGGRSLFC